MPSIYISGKLEVEVDLPKDEKYLYKQWTDKKLALQRKEYDNPCISMWFQIENIDEPISPFTFTLSDLDIYEGILKFEQNERKFKFVFDGKAKSSVHKLTKDEIDKGRKPLLNSVVINGEGFSIDERETNLLIQSKKPK